MPEQMEYVSSVSPLAGLQFHLRHCRNGGKRLAAETHRAQSKQIGRLAYLGSGMALEREARIRFRHPLSIVNYLDAGLARVRHQYVYLLRFGIDGVLYQFLHHRCRTLNDLSGRNLIGNRIGQPSWRRYSAASAPSPER